VLGQTVLGFKVSIAQILVTVGLCGLIELVAIYIRHRRLAWPASGLLAGNGVAFILRAGGTHHGDWWSLNGVGWFLLAAVLALGSKYLIRAGGRHVFNPANFGLVVCLLLVGSPLVYPQYLWWGPMGPAVAAAWVVIVLGAIWVLGPLRMLPMAAAFLVTMALAVAAFAALGQCFDAVWRSDSVCGLNYWIGIALSPELAIFALFMMSDPRTAPSTQRGRLVFGVATAVVASGLLALQPTEYGVKVAILAALMVVLSMVPVIDGRSVDSAGGLVGGLIAMIVVLLVFSLVSNEDLIRTERGGRAWKQATFEPFALSARYARGDVLLTAVDSDRQQTKRYGDVPILSATATHDPDSNEVVLFLVNRSPEHSIHLTARLHDVPSAKILQHAELAGPDIRVINTPAQEAVRIRDVNTLSLLDGTLEGDLPACSWTMVRLSS